MSRVGIDPFSYKARSGKRAGQTKGILDEPIFAHETFEKVVAELNERSYENEIHQFVERLMNGIGSFEKTSADRNGDNHFRECCYFEDEKSFACNYLLFDCIEMLLKAEITINVIKGQRLELLRNLNAKQCEEFITEGE